MSRARSKSGYGKPPEQPGVEGVPPSTRGQDARDTSATRAGSQPPTSKIAAKWWRKPRIVQLNAGRIEFSMPYQIAVAAGLVLVLALLASYRLGQFAGVGVPGGPASATGQVQSPPAEKLTSHTTSDPSTSSGQAVPPPVAPVDRTPPKTEKVEASLPTGDNVIVLTHYHTMADLGPVQAHFAEHGIVTEIVPESGRYVLQTKQRYQNTTTPGSDGYKAIQKIKEVGALYKGKAPPGYEPFAAHYFSDAYGKKVK
jgi:hypothetical protein